MKLKTVFSLIAGTTALFLLHPSPITAGVSRVLLQESAQPKISPAEAKAMNAISTLPDAAAKLSAAEEFAKKYPKSPVLSQLAQQMAFEVAKVSDTTLKLILAERFGNTFTDKLALAIVQSAKLDAYVNANRLDEAFSFAATIMSNDPEELRTLVQMTLTGTEDAKRGNRKYLKQSQQYGLKAIEIIEANKKPVNMDESSWVNHKAVLPQLYQQTAILSVLSGDTADAKSRISKAIKLDPNEPSSHAFAGFIVNSEYLQLATAYQAMPEGKEKETTLVKLEGMLDNIIDEFAQAVGLATGRVEYEKLVQQLMPDLTSYYKFRHKQSVEGLQQLIDKYKPQAVTKP